MVSNPLTVVPKKLLNELKRRFKAEGILLFGSYARREEKKGSDVDLLILSFHTYDKQQIMKAEKDIRKKYGLDVDLWIMHPKKVFLEIINGNTAITKIVDEARVLQSSYYTSFLKKVSSRWMKKLRSG